MRNDRILWAAGCVLYLTLFGCAPQSGGETPNIESPTISAVEMEKVTPSAVEPTITPTTKTEATTQPGTPQPTQTPRPTPTPTIYPPPEIPLSESGPWLIFMAPISKECSGASCPPHLWAMNPDGTGLTLLDRTPVRSYIIRPTEAGEDGSTIIYVTHSTWSSADHTLKMITLPDLEMTTITPLVGAEGSDAMALNSVFDTQWFLWSPDGNVLAFTGLLEGRTVGVYTYDFTSKTITHLTDTTNTEVIDYDDSDETGFYEGAMADACWLRWSPDGRYVVYVIFSGTWGEPGPTGLGAARVDGGRVIRLIDLGAAYNIYGWRSPNEILLQDRGLRIDEPESDIYAFNLDTGETTSIFDDEFSDAAYSEEHDTWLIIQPSGKPLILIRGEGKSEIPNPGFDHVVRVYWSDTDGAFHARVRKDETTLLYNITLDGILSERLLTSSTAPAPYPTDWQGEFTPRRLISPDETLWAWVDHFTVIPDLHAPLDVTSGLWIGAPYAVPREIFSSSEEDRDDPDKILLYDIIWTPDSQRLIYLTNRGLYIAERPDFEPVLIANWYGNPWLHWKAVWLP
jgi:hypothetical protein